MTNKNNLPIDDGSNNRDNPERDNIHWTGSIQVKPVRFHVGPTQKRQFHWIVFALALLLYFIAKAVSVSLNLPIDMYAVVIIVAALAAYHHYYK